jgi:hypothetical protein
MQKLVKVSSSVQGAAALSGTARVGSVVKGLARAPAKPVGVVPLCTDYERVREAAQAKGAKHVRSR